MNEILCAQCGSATDQALDPADGSRAPCSRCGSTARVFNENLTLSVKVGAYLGVHSKHRRGGKGRPYREEIERSELQRGTGRRVSFRYVIDRAKDWYSKRLVDENTSEVLAQVDEPLSAHRGHGAAKRGN